MNLRLKSWKIGIVAAFGLAVMGAVIAADTPVTNGKSETAARVEIGKPAPDFELPLLKQEVNGHRL